MRPGRSILGGWVWKLAARLGASGVPDKPAANALYIYGPDKQYSTALITCLGIAERDLSAIVTAIEHRLRSFDKRVYLTDTADFTVFLRIGALFEYFPPAEDRRKYLADAPWADHLRARYDRLLAKWRPSIVVSYGIPVEQVLAPAPGRVAESA